MCTGAGMLDLAAQAVIGGEVVWHTETDPHAARVLEHRFPGIPNLGDLLAADLPSVDVLVGGLPCQPYSIAGRQEGADDDRDLFQHLPRLVGDLGPRLVLLENVAALLGSPEWGTVCGELANLGYDVRWCVVAASDVGAPHRRRRVFATAYPHSDGLRLQPGRRSGQSRPETGIPEDGPSPWRIDGRDYGPAIARWETVTGMPVPPPIHGRNYCPRFGEWLMGWPPGWVSDLVPARHARRIIGNGVVPQQAQAAYRHLLTEQEPTE